MIPSFPKAPKVTAGRSPVPKTVLVAGDRKVIAAVAVGCCPDCPKATRGRSWLIHRAFWFSSATQEMVALG